MKVDSCFQGIFNTSGESYEEGWGVQIVLTDVEVAALLAAYDPNSGTSPSAAVSREIARPIAEALRQKVLVVSDG